MGEEAPNQDLFLYHSPRCDRRGHPKSTGRQAEMMNNQEIKCKNIISSFHIGDQPKDFIEALDRYLKKGHPIDESIRLVAKNYPALYQSCVDTFLESYSLELSVG